MKSKLSLSSECVEMKLCKPLTSFASHLHSLCGIVWYRTLRVKVAGMTPPGERGSTPVFAAAQEDALPRGHPGARRGEESADDDNRNGVTGKRGTRR